MRVRSIASLAAAGAVAGLGLVGGGAPAQAYPAGAVVLVAQPTGGSPLALPITCVVQTGSQTTGNPDAASWYGSVDCTAPVTMSGDADLDQLVFSYNLGDGSEFSCSGCTSGRSTGTNDDNSTTVETKFNLDVTAPAGYTWQVVQGLQGIQSYCNGVGTASLDCAIFSLPWVNFGV